MIHFNTRAVGLLAATLILLTASISASSSYAGTTTGTIDGCALPADTTTDSVRPAKTKRLLRPDNALPKHANNDSTQQSTPGSITITQGYATGGLL